MVSDVHRPAGGRRRAREAALRALFQLELAGGEWESAYAYNAVEMDLAVTERDFTRRLVEGVWHQKSAIDETIKGVSRHWALSRMTKTDLSVLRLAVYEMLFQGDDDVPAPVAVNEAVELAKQYGNDDSGRFVNGVLGQLIGRAETEY